MLKILSTILFIVFIVIPLPGQSLKVSGRLNKQIDAGAKNITVWIYFADKGISLDKINSGTITSISQRALKRREKVIKDSELYNKYDLPVYEPYVNRIEQYLQKRRIESRWLNAVSAEVKMSDIKKIAAFPFVQKIDMINAYKRKESLPETDSASLKKTNANLVGDSLAYLVQIQQIKADKMHEKGTYGQGVLICMLDDGYRLYRSHEVFDSLDVVKTWDFINSDSTVDDTDYSSEGFHGSMTLSTIGGYSPGKLIGTAYKASFMLGKTEIDSAEWPIEEDYWVAGLEWADAEGADIVSSSLGYIDWYTWQDMDGQTPVTTQATIIAEQKGLLVVNSAGNEGTCDTCNTLIAPADGEFVLTVGAVTSSGYRSSFSSIGPTYDGRIKPDVMAMGTAVTVASYSNTQGYGLANGTSFSCPLTAGAAALLLSANSGVTPAQIRMAMRLTAGNASNPDRYMGWGIINTDFADYYLKYVSIDKEEAFLPQTYILGQNYPNPFNPATKIFIYLPESGEVELDIYTILGRKVKTLAKGFYAKGGYYFNWDGKTNRSVALSSGVYIYTLKSSNTILSKKMVLLR